MGPSESAGKNVNAPTITTTPTSSDTKRGPCVGSVPAEVGVYFLAASDPAAASSGTIIRKRPISIARPRLALYHGVFALSPPNALPLFPVALEYAYRISENPCGPGLPTPAAAGSRKAATAV